MHIYLDSHALSGLKLMLNSAAKNNQFTIPDWEMGNVPQIFLFIFLCYFKTVTEVKTIRKMWIMRI